MAFELNELFETSLQHIEQVAGDTFTWNGIAYSCINSPVETSEEYEETGKRTMSSGTLEATKSQFLSGLPKVREPIFVNGQKLSIRAITTDETTIRIRYGTVAL